MSETFLISALPPRNRSWALPMTRRRFALALPALAVAGLLAALPTTVAAAAPPAPRGAAVDQIRLPDGFQPEGIAIDNRGTAYFGSLVDGDIYAPSRAQAICPIRPRSSRCRSRGRVQQEGFNANGIALTTNRQALLGVYSLVNGDGLLMVNRTLYVVQNRLNQVAAFRLDVQGTSGTLEDIITSAAFRVPTTVAAYRQDLSLPNARFGTPPTPTTTTRCVWIAHPLQGRTT